MNTKVAGITFASTMLFATITSGLLLCSSSTHAADDSAVTVTEITVPSSCSMTANVSTPHIADIVNGNRAINIGKTTLSTFCNDPGGFAIYAIGYTNNELGSTDVIASNNTDTIATGNTAPSNNSSWGMKVVNNSSSSFPATITPYFDVATNDGYVAVPSTFTLMASRNSGTAMDSATLLDTTYGAYISPTQPVGEYNGQVLYTMVHPSSAAGPNAGTMFEAAFLMQPTPPTKKTVGSNSYYKMQDMTPDICTVMSIGAEGQMVDDRDDKIYWVLKAKDGKCWMTQNLDHDIVTTANFYTPANTDVDVAWTASAATLKTIDSGGNFTEWSNSNTEPYSADPGDWYWTGTYYNDACTTGCNYLNGVTEDKFSTTPYSENGTHGSVGNIYNWTAAIASNNSANITLGEATTSVCPAGWRLPSDVNNEFISLLDAYDARPVSGDTRDERLTRNPLYFVRGGFIDNTSLNAGGRNGFYWSNTAQSSTGANDLVFKRDAVIRAENNRFYGFSVRCVARTGTEPVSVNKAFSDAGKTTVNISGTNYYKMQDINSTICGKITKGQTGKLVDTRDNTVYNVGKLEDDRCWLQDNLAIDLVSVSLATLKGNTNASDTALEYLKGTRTGTTSDQYATAAVANWTSSYSYSAPLQNTASINVLPTAYNGTDEPMASQVTAGQWKVGAYYNYCAASAGTYCWGNGTSNTGSPSSDPNTSSRYDIGGDICPYGWRMPTGWQGESEALATIINGATGDITDSTKYTNFRTTLRLPLSGYYYSGSARSQGNNGSFWYSTWNGISYMGRLYAQKTTISPAVDSDFRYNGFSVRCIAK